MDKDTKSHLFLIYVVVLILFVMTFAHKSLIIDQGRKIKQLEAALQIYKGE